MATDQYPIEPLTHEWAGNKALEYLEFNAGVPSDGPGYDVILEHFVKPGGRVLDWGCNAGNFSRAMLSVAEEVVGVDINAIVLEEARKASTSNRISYKYLDPAQIDKWRVELKELGKFDTITFTFTDPVMPTAEELALCVELASELLVEGGNIVFFRLNPGSFTTDSHYNYYGERVPEDGYLIDGCVFTHTLRLPNGKAIELNDHFYSNEYLHNVLVGADFDNIRQLLLGRNLRNGIGDTMRRSIKKMEETYGIESKDEWGEESGAPLYQIFYATKKRKDIEA